jgi:hypothetical protein
MPPDLSDLPSVVAPRIRRGPAALGGVVNAQEGRAALTAASGLAQAGERSSGRPPGAS